MFFLRAFMIAATICSGLIGAETVLGLEVLHHGAMVETGEIQNAPLILTALWLQRERPSLRARP